MSTSRTKRVADGLREKEFREAYVAEHIESGVAFQIHALREKLGLSQAELAKRAGMHQSQISKLENPDNDEGVNLGTLQRLAAAFDVALSVRFVSFGDLVEWEANLSEASLAPSPFAEDPKLQPAVSETPKRLPHEDRTFFVEVTPRHQSLFSTKWHSRKRRAEMSNTTAISDLWLR